MNISFYDASVSPMKKAVSNLRDIMTMGQQYAADNGLSEQEVLAKKMADDMLDLGKQIYLAKALGSDQGLLRVVGLEPSPAPANIASFEDADAALAAMLVDLDNIDAAAFDKAMMSPVFCTLPPGCAHFNDCLTFVQQWAVPHVYFHVTTAYCILRNMGVPLGKKNYLGSLEMEMVPHAK